MLWECLECSTRYALDLQACPHCGSTHREEGDMPKITRHGGPSDAREAVPNSAADEPAAAAEGGEQPSPGTSSSPSPQKTASTSKKSAATRPRRARTTGSRSSRDREVNSSAPSTATGPSDTADI